jgi:hypothetical protein
MSKADKRRQLRIRQAQIKPGPKLLDGERYPSGDLKPAETEREAMSVVLLQRKQMGVPEKLWRDQKAGSTLGRMCLANKITEIEYEGGQHYADVTEAYYRAIGCPSPNPRAQDLTRLQGKSHEGDVSEDRQAQMRRAVNRWMAMQTKIMDVRGGAGLKSTLYNLCILDIEGLFFMPAEQLAMLKEGLIKLAIMKGLQIARE